MMRMIVLAIVLIICYLAYKQAMGQGMAGDITGRVVRVYDGDTITVQDAQGVRHTVRLAGIDAPETRQAHGLLARDALRGMVLQKTVSVAVVDTDRYSRTVGVVRVGGECINLGMIMQGHAWLYRDYTGWMRSDELRDYDRAEAGAKRAGRGLWAAKRPLAPWAYRKARR